MAAAAPSPLASSVEKTNGAKLSRLLIDGGTTVLRNLFDHYHPPANLRSVLYGNHVALNDLLNRRVLHRPQWHLLFPPGGATPDSKTFDITLLFLLLTNICGLSPPPSGWHVRPPPGDTSVEANLAGIKFFRNVLYGHVTTTGVDTPTFSSLWQEISAVVVALGLNQAEIDRLRAERCGEEDYINVLLEWADSEEDIKSQLKDVRQSQTKVQQTVDEVRKTQVEDHEILEDSKVKLEGLHQVQEGTQKAVVEVRQTQLEDRWRLEKVLQIEKTTHHVVTESHQTQLEDSQAIHEMRQNQTNTEKLLQETKAKVEGVSQSLETLKLQFQPKSEGLEGERSKHSGDEILKNLANVASLKDVRHHSERYVNGTRMSIFAKVESWLDDRSCPNRVMVITGNPGMGKSVISAVMYQKMLQAGRLAGSHFCQHDRARHRNPKVMLQSLASHLADSLPDYKKVLVEKLSRNLGVEINDMEVKELFELLFEEPLTMLNDPGLTYLMIIDGIDESEYQGRNELLDVIVNYFKKLPPWIRFLVTTRPEVNIGNMLTCLQPVQLEPNSEENLKDIHLCFKEHLRRVLPSDNQEIILQALVRKSEGVMLYAHYMIDFIKEKVARTSEVLDSTLPSGVSSVYHSYFNRLETDLRKELKVTEDQFMNLLSAMAAAREPLPLGFVSKLLLSGTFKSPSAVPRKVNVAISCVSALLPVQDGRIHFFHKSVKDWLIDASNYGQHHFSVDEKEGHCVLSKLCIDELDDVKRKGVDGAHFTETTKYALQHGVQHMLQLNEKARICGLEDVGQKYCLNLELVYAKLCVGVTASEDILSVIKQADTKALFEEWQRAPGALLYLLRKHLSTLTELPHAIFQTLLNEGEPELSSEASTLLETRYSEIPYMEFVYKNDLKGLVQTKFQCSAEVVCFDVSPRLDYMVCECQNDTIQLWSLHTGKQLWKRLVTETNRTGQVLSFYRSVVFHPAEDLVLPGILSHAYTFDGDLKPLFLSSKCRFSVCSVSADKAKMITDCPDNAKSIIMWSLEDGSEIIHCAWNEDILSFAWSRDGRLLAISHSFGLISLVDVVDGFKILARTTCSKECEMIKFTPDCQFLFCLHSGMHEVGSYLFRFYVKMENDCNFSLVLFPNGDYYYPWNSESCTETGFLLGDLFYYPFIWRPELAFVLNEQSALRVSYYTNVIEMLHPDKLTKDKDECSKPAMNKVVFSLDCDTLYVVSEREATSRTLMAWDILSEQSKAEKNVDLDYVTSGNSFLVAVRTGVLFRRCTGKLELWNIELSECIRSWTDIGDLERVIPISEERVACEVRDRSKVIILDTTSGGIVSTITIHGFFVACNSKCQVITTGKMEKELQMQCGEVVLWKNPQPFDVLSFLQCNTFSPTEQYCIVGGRPEPYYEDNAALFVLDAVSGRTLHMLCTSRSWVVFKPDCKFVSAEECVISIDDASRGYCLQLFNVKSGDLLSVISVESTVCSLAACPRNHLIAIGLEDAKHGFTFLQVKLPRVEGSRKDKSDRIKLQE